MYDTRVFMATGYLVASGQNPYVAKDLSSIFTNPAFQNINSIGYPPPWALVLGIIYKLSYSHIHSLLFYNLAIKIPVIASNICLSYLVVNILKRLRVRSNDIDRAWIFMLFNPFLLYISSVWGQIDSIVTLFSLLALTLLYERRLIASALSISISLAFKPIALPVLLLVLIILWKKNPREAIKYFFTLLICLVILCLAPFYVFNWDPIPILSNWNFHFTVLGGISIASLLETLLGTYKLPGLWWFFGLLWIPALGIGLFSLNYEMNEFTDVLQKCLVLTLIFFLTRTWLSEPNIMLILPLVVILTYTGNLDRRILNFVWLTPLIFTVFNGSAALLLFPGFPSLMYVILGLLKNAYYIPVLFLKSVLAISWQIVGWVTVTYSYKKEVAIHNK